MFTSLSGKVFLIACILFLGSVTVQAQTTTGRLQETTLTKSESKKMTRLLCKCFTLNKHMYPLQRYDRQYVAYVNANGEKEVLVSCYYKRTKTELGEAKAPGMDGKQSYFRATINLRTQEAKDYGFHDGPSPSPSF